MPRWDSYDAYLFDLDGTLLHCRDAVHYFGFCHALHLLSGRALALDGVVAHGNTDLGILRDALTVAGCQETIWRPLLPNAVKSMERFVLARESEMKVQAIAGAESMLIELRKRGAILGVATGNLKTIGALKLRLSGLDNYFRVHGFSDQLYSRSHVFARALDGLRDAHPEVRSVCVVGDTPADVHSAHENAVDAIAVATGVFSMEELAAAGPEYLVPSLNTFFKDELE